MSACFDSVSRIGSLLGYGLICSVVDVGSFVSAIVNAGSTTHEVKSPNPAY